MTNEKREQSRRLVRSHERRRLLRERSKPGVIVEAYARDTRKELFMIAASLADERAALALEYAGTTYWVRGASFVLGRSRTSDLVIDDGSVSRRHARITNDGVSFAVEDLGSRNGVRVNGRRLFQRSALQAGDVLELGSATIAVREDGASSEPIRSERPSQRAQPFAPALPLDGIFTFTSSVDQALLSGRVLEAERLFAVHLGRPAEYAAARGQLEPAVAKTLSLLALRLGEATGSGVWLDFAVRLYAASGTVAPLSVVSAMHSLARRLGGIDQNAVRQYLEQLGRLGRLVSEERRAVDGLQALAAMSFSSSGLRRLDNGGSVSHAVRRRR